MPSGQMIVRAIPAFTAATSLCQAVRLKFLCVTAACTAIDHRIASELA